MIYDKFTYMNALFSTLVQYKYAADVCGHLVSNKYIMVIKNNW